MAIRQGQLRQQQGDEEGELIMPQQRLGGQVISVAPLQTINLRRLQVSDASDTSKLRSAVEYPGCFYLEVRDSESDLRGDGMSPGTQAATSWQAAQAILNALGWRRDGHIKASLDVVSSSSPINRNTQNGMLKFIFSDYSGDQPTITTEIRLTKSGLPDEQQWAHVIPKSGCVVVAVSGSRRRIARHVPGKGDSIWLECTIN